ncbi:fibronectin type III domain-containing protein [Vibrio parahaemolyticus]|uniref:fibronectin type III domain-containing protein n=1 Tax=Vibrio parahaemolyticus TaxID=670 RepID=UPI0022B59F3A|nr:fibronectin type III domain-containing protein [Vibrio parahaemolyticus]MCZ6362899.1 fibronectin type III domain-containing protein [Vibrio parahaemolyticus]MCZ6367446.1 fibronectin type III domain-containing protein [Vibrio parahaemolyticus]
MNCENLLSWKIVLELPESLHTEVESSNLFNFKTGNSFLKGVGGFSDYTFSPEVLDPTNVFHNALNKVKLSLGFKGRRFPYTSSDDQQLNVNIRRFGSRVVIVTIQLKKPFVSDDSEIYELQKISNHPDIYTMAKSICGLILSGDCNAFNAIHSPKVYPCTQSVILGENNWISDRRAVEILTRHIEPNENIVSKVISKNVSHQLDASNILIDRQGIFYRVPERLVNSHSVNKKHLGTCNIFEYAVALSKVLEKKYFDNLDCVTKDYLKKLILEPELVILHSVTSLETWRLLVIEFKLDSLLSTVSFEPKLTIKREPWWTFFTNISTESKRFWIICLIISGLCWAFQQSIYFDKLTSFFSMPEIEVIKPGDQEVIEVSDNSILIKWEEVDGASKYVINLHVLDSGKWALPPVDHRLIATTAQAKLTVSPKSSYKFSIEAYDSHGDQIAKSDESFFGVTTKKVTDK